MRRARITYPGAFHHAMNRGHDGMEIFKNNQDKELFLELIKKNKEICKISIHAFCIMDTHFHLIVQNDSGRISDFFKRINGEFGSIFRKKYGGRGYVFQDRFKSTLIQEDSYLLDAISYVLNNPVDAGIVPDFSLYKWSSADQYFMSEESQIIDNSYVKDSFDRYDSFSKFVNKKKGISMKILITKMGSVLGDKSFIEKAKDKFDRRKKEVGLERKRINDLYFESVEKVYFELERKYKTKIEHLDITTFKGKRLRGELLVNLKDRSGITYKEISKLDAFSDVKFNSLGRIYKDSKERLKKHENSKTKAPSPMLKS